jgi:hypothetical protein
MKITKQQLKQIIKEEIYLIQSGQDHESVFHEELESLEQKRASMIQRFMDPRNLNKYNLRPGSDPGEVLDMDGNPFLAIRPSARGYEVAFYAGSAPNKTFEYDDLVSLEKGVNTAGARIIGPPNLRDESGALPRGRFQPVQP